ncbi:MAG: tetratricopeptide repeat protein, partial [Candidatus Hodarchaeota archaeon]
MVDLQSDVQGIVQSIQQFIQNLQISTSSLTPEAKKLYLNLNTHELIDEARNLYILGNYSLSRMLLLEVLNTLFNTLEKNKCINPLIDALYTFAWTWQETGDFDIATKLFNKQLALSHAVRYPLGQANAYNGLATVAHKCGYFNPAIEYYERSLMIKKQLDNPISIAVAYNNIATNLRMLGYYDMALDKLEQAKEIFNASEENKDRNLAFVFGNMSGVLCEKGDLDAALDLSTKCLQSCLAGGVGGMDFVEFLQFHGHLWYSKGDFQKALDTLLECERKTRELKTNKLDLLILLCHLLIDMNRLKKAQDYLTKVETLLKKHETVRDWALYLFARAELDNKRGLDQTEVEYYYLQAKRFAETLSFFRLQVLTRLALSRLNIRQLKFN